MTKKVATSRPSALPVSADQSARPTPTRRPRSYWSDFRHVEQALLAFIAQHGQAGQMPTMTELDEHGLSGLTRAIRQQGGAHRVAERLGLAGRRIRRPNGFWSDIDNLRRELVAFAAQQGTPGIMPSIHALRAAGHVDLVGAIIRHGPLQAVAERVGLTYLERQKPKGYWSRPGTLARELKQFMADHNCQGVMPTEKALFEAGRGDLAEAISSHGGFRAVAERLGLATRPASKARGYWTDPANLEREMREFILRYGTASVMPSGPDLERAGRADLLWAIHTHGGLTALAKRLGLSPAPQRRARRWTDFAILQEALRDFCQAQRLDGQMPTKRQLAAAGRNDLIGAIYRYGGFGAVAERLGLARAGQPKRR